MTPTRRDIVKFLAAIGATGVVVPHVADAERLLDAPPVVPEGEAPAGEGLYDPASFAANVESGLFFHMDEYLDHRAAEEMAAYKQAHAALERAAPTALRVDLIAADEAAMNMWVVAFENGLRVGAACENLRLAVLTPTRVCKACQGYGATTVDGGWYVADERDRALPCADCQGRGTVPTPGVKLTKAA